MVIDLEQARAVGISERQFATATNVHRSTLRHWDARKKLSAAAGVPWFLETPEGVRWLHRLFWAAIFVMTLRCPAGIRAICELFELAGLDSSVATSFGSIQKMATQMQEAVIAAGDQQRRELVEKLAGQPRKAITACQDETFHPTPCLVAQEPVSGFILVEKYAERRDAATWTAAMDEALAKLPVDVVQTTTDQARALLKHAREGLGAHHSPDLFHVLRDLHKATTRPLISRQEAAQRAVADAAAAVQRVSAHRDAWRAQKRHRPGRPPDFELRMRRAREAERVAIGAAAAADADRENMRAAINRIAAVYHPVDLITGELQSAETVATRIGDCFAEIDDIAFRAGIGDRQLALIEKAWRVVDEMTDTIGWAHVQIASRLAALDLGPECGDEVVDRLLPALYIERVASKADTAAERRELQAVAERLFDGCRALMDLADDERSRIVKCVAACADLFQRSSSCTSRRGRYHVARLAPLARGATATLRCSTTAAAG